MNKTMKADILFLKKKNKDIEINFVVNLSELTHVMQKMVMMHSMRLVKYKCLVNLKTKNKRKR